MKTTLLTLVAVFFICFASMPASVEASGAPKGVGKDTGTIFQIEISSPGKPSITWKNWIDNGMYYGETVIGGNRSMIIIKNGFSYSLSPDIKVARKSKIELDEKKNPLAGKYGVLADIPQIDPASYLTTIKNLKAKSKGPKMLTDNRAAVVYSLLTNDSPKFPWNNFTFWIERDSSLPIKTTYTEGSEKRTLTFKNIETNVKIKPSRFDVPAGYKEIFFEWD